MTVQDRALVKPTHGGRTIARSCVKILGAGLSIALLSGAAWTAERGTADERRACTPDVFKHCGEFIPNAERITTCLREKVRELSPDCRVVMIGPRKR
jgi:hypothetical protein